MGNVCKISVKTSVFNSMVAKACQNFQFFRQYTWFLENNGALSKIL